MGPRRWAVFLYAALRRQLLRWERESVQRQEAEAGLKLVRQLLDRSNDAIFIVDPETSRPLDVNETACRQRGYSKEELCRLTAFELSETVNESFSWKEYVGQLKAAGSMAYETRHRRKDGSSFPVEASMSYVECGRESLLIAVIHDISERRSAQAELQSTADLLRAVAEVTTDAVFVKDSEGRYLFFNEAAARFVGRPVAEVLGNDDRALFSPESARFVMERDRAVMLSGRVRTEEETLTSAGVTRTYLATKGPYRDFVGNVIGLIGISRDITDRIKIEEALRDISERKAAEAAIRKTNQELERRVQERTHALEDAIKELEAFSYSVSHDLRAPLRHIQGYVELLERVAGPELSAQAQRYLRIIRESGQQMGQLIDDLLAFSRVGRIGMTQGAVSLGALVKEVIGGMEMATQGRNLQWQIGALPVVVGDAPMLKVVLTNLIGNAVKYTRPRDPARIEISSEGERGGRVAICVRDNGVGFDMEYAHKLFGVFQRLHRSDEFEGTGIGLATVRRIVARHGGCVTAKGAVDEGSTFCFTLEPFAHFDAETPESDEPDQTHPAGGGQHA